MKTGIHIGAVVDKNALEPLTESILKILDARADQETIRFALAMVGKVAETSNVTLNDVNVTNAQEFGALVGDELE